jgi:carbonic anhydrase
VGAKLIVVLGHTNCGAVKGAIDRVELGNLTGLLAKIRPAVEAAGCSDAKDETCVERVGAKNVLHSMKEIRERSPYIAKALEEGKVDMVGAM